MLDDIFNSEYDESWEDSMTDEDWGVGLAAD